MSDPAARSFHDGNPLDDPQEPARPPAVSGDVVTHRQEIVTFYGDQVLAVQTPDGTIYVPMRPLCETIGLTWPSQSRRIGDDPKLHKHARSVRVQTAGGPQDLLALPLKLIPGWLFGIQARRLKPELQARVERYHDECYEVLWEAFRGGILPATAPNTGLAGAEMALEIAEAVAALARQQLDLERRHSTMADYMRGHVRQTNAHLHAQDARLTALELHLGPSAPLTDGQAAEIALAVKAVAGAWARQDGGNHYGQVYDALYRRFGVSAYRNLPQTQYAPARSWLHTWATELNDAPAGT